MQLSLSVLDQSTIVSGRTAADALRETVALAPIVETAGYRRYWLAEHHNTPSHAGSAPEILITAVLGATKTIRVGSAGVMLPHYSALKVAEQFRVIEALYPNRADLGLGRAPGSDGITAYALNPHAFQHGAAQQGADQFPTQVNDLLHWLGGGLPDTHPLRMVRATPDISTQPQVWILGSSDYGAQLAAHFGLPYCFADFISERGGDAVCALYRERFRPSPYLAAPLCAVAVYALAADTEAAAFRLARGRELFRVRRARGEFLPLATPEEADAYPFTPEEEARSAAWRRRALLGAPETVAARLAETAARHGADEVAILTPCHDFAARARSYQLIAEATKSVVLEAAE
jgi:luciferase family oxidoreductase group 1